MSTFKMTSRVSPDGKLTLDLPEALADQDVDVTVETKRTTNGAAHANGKALSREQWSDLIRKMTGQTPDFPDIERAGPEAYDEARHAHRAL